MVKTTYWSFRESLGPNEAKEGDEVHQVREHKTCFVRC